MLKQRIITALILLAILLPALFFSNMTPLVLIAIALITAAAWEWANLNQCSPTGALVVGSLAGLGCATAWAMNWHLVELQMLWILAGCIWVAGGALLLKMGVSGWVHLPKPIRLGLGVFSLWVAWLALVQARVLGVNFLVSTLVLVWIADVFAYFSGRGLGGRFFTRKLAPSISPGKTWEGAIGGLVGVVLGAIVWRYVDVLMGAPDLSIFSRLGQSGLFFMIVAVSFLSVMSVVGDLVESLFKRSAGFKDSSGLLPGHGGVLDRLDALLPVLPLAMLLTTL